MKRQIDRGECPECGNGSFRVAGYGALPDLRVGSRLGREVVYAVCTRCDARVEARDRRSAGRWCDRWILWDGGDQDRWPPAKVVFGIPHWGESPERVEHETITIGEGHGKILEVSEDRIRYRNEDGRELSLGLTRYVDNVDRYVGSSALDGGWSMPTEPPDWVMISGDDRYVQFAFETYEAAYEHLLIPLGKCGYRTFDRT